MTFPLPLSGSLRTIAPAALAISTVRSVEPLSYTKINASGREARKSAMSFPIADSSLRHGTSTATWGFQLIDKNLLRVAGMGVTDNRDCGALTTGLQYIFVSRACPRAFAIEFTGGQRHVEKGLRRSGCASPSRCHPAHFRRR